MTKLRRFLAMSAEDRRTLVRALATLCAVWLSLRTAGFRRTRAWLEPRRALERPPSRARVRSLTLCVERAARLLPRVACLERSLVLWSMLRRIGARADLRIGVRRAATTGLSGHAWVELDGDVLNDHPAVDREYQAFPGTV